MELAFNVDAGPLSQISVPLFSLSSAVQLAVGTYGWWCARRRTKSLQAVLESAGASLAPAHMFYLPTYTHLRRENDMIRGLVVQDGKVLSVDLPRSSTGCNDDAGKSCLRALTAGLLCLYDVQAVAELLVELIPYALLQFQQEDMELKLEGPLRGSLNDYVNGVSVEEDSNLLRQRLLQRLDLESSKMAIGSKERKLKFGIYGSDHAKVRGLLRWMLAPASANGRQPIYPTRSLLAWSVGFVLSNLGFQVTAANSLIVNKKEYEDHIKSSWQSDFASEIILVTAQTVVTDPMEAHGAPWKLSRFLNSEYSFLKARVIPIHAIPLIAFRATQSDGSPDIQHLADVWHYTFDYVRQKIIYVSDQGPQFPFRLKYEDWASLPSVNNGLPINDYVYLSSWFQVSAELVGTLLRGCTEKFLVGRYDLRKVQQILSNEELKTSKLTPWKPPPAGISEPWHIMMSMLLACCYAFFSLSILDNNSPAGLQTEIAFHPLTVQSNIAREWLSTLVRHLPCALNPLKQHTTWRDILSDMATGTLSPRLDDQSLENNFHHHNEDQLTRARRLGRQKNGVLIINDLLVRPSLSIRHGIWFHHVRPGQAISLPVDSLGYLHSSERFREDTSFAFSEKDKRLRLTPPDPSSLNSCATLRIDAEPDWENDPSKITLVARVKGRLVHTMSPKALEALICRSAQDKCTCQGFEAGVSPSPDEHWYEVNLARLVSDGEFAFAENIYVVCGADGQAGLLASYILAEDPGRKVGIATECLPCMYLGLQRRREESRGLSSQVSQMLLVNAIAQTSAVK